MIQAHLYSYARPRADSAVERRGGGADIGAEPAAIALIDALGARLRAGENQRQCAALQAGAAAAPVPAAARAWAADNNAFGALAAALADGASAALADWADPFEGHLLIAGQQLLEQRSLWVFWLMPRPAWAIDSGGALRQQPVLDPGQLRLGASLDLNAWLADPAAVAFNWLASRGLPELSDWLPAAFCAAEALDRAAETERFLAVVDRYTELLGDDERAGETRREVVDYCLAKSRAGEPAALEELSGQLDPERPSAFAEFVYEHDQGALPPRAPSTKALRDYMRFAGRDRDQSLSFAAHLLGAGVTWDAERETLHFERLPAALREQLQRHLGEGR